MVNVIYHVTDARSQEEIQSNMYKLKNICLCHKCGAIIQFDTKDIDYSKALPHISCTCGSFVQLHRKYVKNTKRITDWSPVIFYLENDMDSLKSKLDSMAIDELKIIVRKNKMDGTSKYLHMDKAQLISLICDMSYKRGNKGNAFRN